MKKDITLLEEYRDILIGRIQDLEKEQQKYLEEKKHDLYFTHASRILELQSQWYAVQGLIIKNI